MILVFSVGAIDHGGNVADFSSRGPVTADGSGRVKPEIVAPGVAILSSLPGGTYGESDGTSMAGPHVVGAVALLWSADPALIGNIDRTEQILTNTAQPYTGSTSTGCFQGDVPKRRVWIWRPGCLRGRERGAGKVAVSAIACFLIS